jgi:signal transduction histidine kinase
MQARICVGVALTVLGLAGMLAGASRAVSAAETKRVLIVHSFGRDFKPWKGYAETVRSELTGRSPWSLYINEQVLTSARSSNDAPEPAFVEYLRALYAPQPPDLIISFGAPAAHFVQRYRAQLFPDAPMVLTAIERRRIQQSALGAKDVVVAVSHNFAVLFENILQVLPDTKTVMVVNGVSPNEAFWKPEIIRELEPLKDRIALTWTDDVPFAEIVHRAATLPPHTAIFWHSMIVDPGGLMHEGDSALSAVYASANAPIFSFDESFFGREVVGGPMNSIAQVSGQAVAVAMRVLAGEDPADIKVPAIEFAKPKFDWRQMQRWGINESRLPAGSEIRFREPTVWDRYHGPIALTGLAILFQSALITILIIEGWRRRTAEARAQQLLTELAHVNRVATVGQFTASLTHELRQPLAAISLAGQAALNWIRRKDPDLAEAEAALQQVVEGGFRADGVIKSLHAMFNKEHTPRTPVDVNEMVEQVLALAKVLIKAKNVAVEQKLTDVARPTVLGEAVQLQQILLNLINNAVESMAASAGGRRVLQLATVVSDDTAVITVMDSGPGVEPQSLDRIFEPFFTSKPGGMGMGLSICRSIAEAHGGTLTAVPGELGGLRVRLTLPLVEPRTATSLAVDVEHSR